ncbi:hypothetical protein DIGNKC_14 [Bacillus phage DIGNKC]|nr:hypothetical protein BI007_gp014 [Bacillus phage DIGNKC]AMW62906.1 hypothetical protein DIGNKC_14 [Bacillus phage DIGNKC]AOZ61636.1 hypothetical protein BJ4_13 [Bacillus phage BJ4]
MFKRLGEWLCKRGRHDKEILGSSFSFGVLTVRTECKRCGKKQVFKSRG